MWASGAALVSIVGAVEDAEVFVEVARPLFFLMCAVLLVCWNAGRGILSTTYAVLVVAGQLCLCVGSVLASQPEEYDLAMLAFLAVMVGSLCLGVAFWTPSVPLSYMNDVSVDASWSAGEWTYGPWTLTQIQALHDTD